MNVLFLGPDDSPTRRFLTAAGERTVSLTGPATVELVHGYDFLVSHGYRHILKRDVLELFPGRAVNLHIAYLPWNRGADPNLWSWIEGTPKGVTIHYIDEGIDTGDVIAQRLVEFHGDETLSSSYARLQREMVTLFEEWWPLIRSGRCGRARQVGAGSYHRSADKERLGELRDGWDTAVSDLMLAAPPTY